MKTNWALVLACGFVMLNALYSCDDDPPTPPKRTQVTIVDLQKQWFGSYEGWDSLMNVRTQIQKELVLFADSSYTNTIGGIVYFPSAANTPQLFEKEAGKYSIEISDTICRVTFIARYDSIVDFGTSRLVGYEHKHCHKSSGEEYDLEQYTQTFSISDGKNGNCRLCTVDSALYSLDGQGKPILYYLNVQELNP